MAAAKTPISSLLQPLCQQQTQLHLGTGLHTLGLLRWVLEQTDASHIMLTTFSTSEEFLCGFHRLRRDGLVIDAVLIADIKAARKTVHLDALVRNCFDSVELLPNHSKVVLISNDAWQVTILTSQNQTYGDRIEQTLISTDRDIFNQTFNQLFSHLAHGT